MPANVTGKFNMTDSTGITLAEFYGRKKEEENKQATEPSRSGHDDNLRRLILYQKHLENLYEWKLVTGKCTMKVGGDINPVQMIFVDESAFFEKENNSTAKKVSAVRRRGTKKRSRRMQPVQD